MKQLIFFLVFFSIIGCSFEKKDSAGKLPELSVEQEMKLDSVWNILVQVQGCLVGQQYDVKSRWWNKPDGSVLYNNSEWKRFFRFPKKDLTLFLTSKFEKTVETGTHTCPFFSATEGELAVYALQIVHKKNWFDFDEFSEYQDKKITASEDNHQRWIQDILADPNKCTQLRELWLKRVN